MKATILVATTIKEFEREHVRSQKLSTDVRKRFRQVVNSLENKNFVTKTKNNLIFPFSIIFETRMEKCCGKTVKNIPHVCIGNIS